MNVKMNTERMQKHFEQLYKKVARGESREEVLKNLGKGLLLCLYTYLLASTRGLFDTFPFALSLLAALPERLGFAFVGALTGALFGYGLSVPMLICYIVIFLWRSQVARFMGEDRGAGRSEEPLVMRCLVSFATALGVTVIPLLSNFTYYGLFGAFFMVFACPALTLVFSGAFLEGRTGIIFYAGGRCLLRFCLVLACKEFSIFGFVPALAVASFISVLEYTAVGAVQGCFAGFFAGLALGIDYGVLLAILSLVGGVVNRIWPKMAVGAGLLAGLIYGYALQGAGAFFSIFPDVICGGLLAVPLVRIRLANEPPQVKESATASGRYLDGEESRLRQQQEEQTVKSMQQLSRMFVSLSENRFPDHLECEQICRRRMESRCNACKASAYCRTENQKQRAEALEGAAKALYRDGSIDGRFLQEVGCAYSAEIADELTLDYAQLHREKSRPRTTEAYAAGFDAIAKLMEQQKEYRRRSRAPRTEAAKEITKRARRAGLAFSTVGVYGFVKKTVFFCDCKTVDCRGGAEGLRKMCEEVLAGKMSYPRTVAGEHGYMTVLESIPAYSLDYATCKKPKYGQSVCGDCVSSFADADGNPCLLLCDGMGSGSRAAVAAGIGCSLSESLSAAGANPALITELLNTTLCHRQEEDSCTFDLFAFDSYSGGGTFIKSGAAPTLIFRKGSVYKLSAQTVPLGVVQDVKSEQMRMQMQADDLVILVSDGIASDFEDTAVLAAVIGGHEEEPVGSLCERVLSECTQKKSKDETARRADDMSVCVIRILAQ